MDKFAIFYILLYMAFYLCIYAINCYKNRSLSILSLKSFFPIYYAFSVFCSLIFFNVANGTVRDFSRTSLIPFVYLAVCFMISMIPFYIFEKRKAKLVISQKESDLLDMVSIIIAVCSILPFIETMFHLTSILSIDESIGRTFEMRRESGHNENYLSFIGAKFYYVLMLFEILTPWMLLFQLWKKNKNIYIIIGLSIAIVTIWLHGMAQGGRSNMVQNAMYFFVSYLIFKHFFSDSENKKILKYGSFLLSIFIFSLMSVSISRFLVNGSSTFDNTFEWMSLYAGEGPLNFNNNMWYVTRDSGGYKTISLFMSLIKGHMISIPEIWDAGDSIGIPGNIYYTWIGSIYSDWGRYTTIVIVIILSSIFSYVAKSHSRFINFSTLAILGIWAKVLIVGPVFFAFTTTNSQLYLLILLVFCFYLNSQSNLDSIKTIYGKYKQNR